MRKVFGVIIGLLLLASCAADTKDWGPTEYILAPCVLPLFWVVKGTSDAIDPSYQPPADQHGGDKGETLR